ncbi:hypothetical protein M8Z33_41340 [Streptomyces sp. ZAF1911]|nr:hypothetical protein [Streptomyces sp. ZAF1911]MDD9382983.1 hypothetical protein [Streptomyces sp. ZAF1911]
MEHRSPSEAPLAAEGRAPRPLLAGEDEADDLEQHIWRGID